MQETWACLNTGHRDAATNMAVDEALLIWHSKGDIPPTIRFYGWERPSLTVGHFQNVQRTIDFKGVKQHNCDFVRRLTGGSAVLHDDELTYSIIVKEDHPKIPHSVNEAYYVLSQGLLEGYRNIGIKADFAKPARDRHNRSAVCFETPAIYEMLVDGKKISGNAQTRKQGVLLQHGSIPMSFDAGMLFDLFQFSRDEIRTRQRKAFIKKAISIHDLPRQNQTFSTLQTAFRQGFENALHVNTEDLILTKEQWEFVEYLRTTKYATDEWNHHKKQITGSV